MENLLPSFTSQLEESLQRTRPNQQWDPSRSVYEAGSMLPARLRCLTKMTAEETAIENPPEVIESSVEPLAQVVSSQGAAEFIEPLPSVLGQAERGQAPAVRISRILPDRQHNRPAVSEGGIKTIIGLQKDPPLLTFVNDAAPNYFEKDDHDLAAEYMTSSTQELLGHDPVQIFLKGEKGLAPMVHHTLVPGTHMVRTVAGGSLPASAVVAASGYQADRGVMVLITTRARLGPAATDSASQCLSEEGGESRLSKSQDRVQQRFDFKVERPLGLELEYDAINHVVMVHKCRAEGQGAALGVQEGSIVLRVAGRPVRTLEEFEDGVVRLRQAGDPTAIIPVVLLAPGEGHAHLYDSKRNSASADKKSLSDDEVDSVEDVGHGLSRLFRQQSLAAERKSGQGSDGAIEDLQSDDDESLGLLGVEEKGNQRSDAKESDGSAGGDALVRDGWAFATGGGMEVEDDDFLLAARADAKAWGGAVPQESELPQPAMVHPLPDLPFAMGVSVDDRVPVTLYFVNQSPHLQLEIGWVDYEGHLVPRKLLGPGDAHLEKSWASHPWLLSAIQPPPFHPDQHESPAEADAFPAEANDADMTLLVRIGESAAKGQSRGYSLLWQPRDRALSFMPQSRTDPGKLRPELDPANATDSATRVRNTRASLVHQLRELRADPSGGANGGKPPTLTVLMMGNQHGVSVLQP